VGINARKLKKSKKKKKKKKVKEMDKIPKDCLGIIFSFLSERFRRYIEITCKEWINLIRDEPHIISSKIRDLSQYFPNSTFPSLDKIKELGIVVSIWTEKDPLLGIDIKGNKLKHNIKFRVYVNLSNSKRRNEYANYLKALYECKFIKILKYKCFICNELGSPGTIRDLNYHGSKCVLCERYIHVCCYNQILQKTCGFIESTKNRLKLMDYNNPEVFYCIDCIDVAVATKKVIICKKCDGYFDITNNKKNDIYCKDCGVITLCCKKRCVKCRQQVCKICNPCDPIPFCNKCLYMCTTCKKFSENLVRCKKCKITRYCSEECQAVDYLDKHTKTCESHLTWCHYCGKQEYKRSTSGWVKCETGETPTIDSLMKKYDESMHMSRGFKENKKKHIVLRNGDIRANMLERIEKYGSSTHILNNPMTYDIATVPTKYDWVQGVIVSNQNLHRAQMRQYMTTPPTKLPRCSRCKMVSYCNETCQERHWKRHKEHCFKL